MKKRRKIRTPFHQAFKSVNKERSTEIPYARGSGRQSGFGQSGLRGQRKPTAEADAVADALQCYEDGIYRLFIDDTETEELTSPVLLKEGSTLTFIRLTLLAGRVW